MGPWPIATPGRAVLLLSNLGAGLTQAAVAVILLTGNYHLVTVAALEFVNGSLAAFTRPALRGIVPDLVPRAALQRANTLLAVSRTVTDVAGPTVSALLVAGFGSGSAIAVDAGSYLVAAALLTKVSGAGRTTSVPSRMLGDLRDGWREFRRIRWIWTVTGAAFFLNLVYVGPERILGPELTRADHGEVLWGVVLSVYGLGMLVTSVVAYRLRVRRLLATGQLCGALGSLILLALGLGVGAPVLLVAAFLAGVGNALSGIAWETSLQEHVRPDVLSRVSSYDELLAFAAIPVGQLLVGPVAAGYGAQPVTLVAGLLFAVFAMLPLASAAVRRLPHTSR